MPRFIDRNATERKTLGPCECQNTPHGEDWIDVRKVLSYNDMLFLNDVSAQQGIAEAMWTLFNLRVADWNLVDEKGRKLERSRRIYNDLDSDTAERLNALIKEVGDAEEGAELPNA